MFELADAVLCGDTTVRSPVELTPSGEHRRGHGSLYAAMNQGRIDVDRLRTALATVPVPRAADGEWQHGDPDLWIVADAGYDGPRLAFLLADLPVQILVRMRSDRVLRRPAPPRTPGTTGSPPRHGGEFVFGDPVSAYRFEYIRRYAVTYKDPTPAGPGATCE